MWKGEAQAPGKQDRTSEKSSASAYFATQFLVVSFRILPAPMVAC